MSQNINFKQRVVDTWSEASELSEILSRTSQLLDKVAVEMGALNGDQGVVDNLAKLSRDLMSQSYVIRHDANRFLGSAPEFLDRVSLKGVRHLTKDDFK